MQRKYVNTSTVFALSAGVFLFVGSAVAQDYTPQGRGSFIIDLRASDVSPDTSSRIVTASGVDSGLHVHVGDSVMPTLGFTYFLTNQLAVEAILGTTEHTISAQGAGTDVKVRSTWVLPPVCPCNTTRGPRLALVPTSAQA